MSFAEVKESVAEMSAEERLEVAALIAHLNRADDTEYQTELDGRMSAMDAGRKISASAVKKVHDELDWRTMIPPYTFVVDDSVLELFTGRSKRESDELLRIFKSLADSPCQAGGWRQKTKSGRELQVKRFGKWLVTFWLDAPVLEMRVVDVKKIVPWQPKNLKNLIAQERAIDIFRVRFRWIVGGI
jgi:hypothetical protein